MATPVRSYRPVPQFGSSGPSSLKKGQIFVPLYDKNDKATREKFWRSLAGEEGPDPIRISQPGKGDRGVKKRWSSSDVTTVIDKRNSPAKVPKEIKENGILEDPEKKRLQEMTQHLHELLRIGQNTPTKHGPIANSELSKSVPVVSQRFTPNSDSKGSPSSAGLRRVPFTARTPKPPPFLPSFSEDGNMTFVQDQTNAARSIEGNRSNSGRKDRKPRRGPKRLACQFDNDG